VTQREFDNDLKILVRPPEAQNPEMGLNRVIPPRPWSTVRHEELFIALDL